MIPLEMARHTPHKEDLPVEAWGPGVGHEHRRVVGPEDTSCGDDHQDQGQHCACVGTQRELAQRLELGKRQE